MAYTDGHGAIYTSRASSRASLSILDSSPPCLRSALTWCCRLPSTGNSVIYILFAEETMMTASSKEWNNDDERLSEVEDASAPEVSGAGWWGG